MNYLFKFHRNEYDWHVYVPDPTLPEIITPGALKLEESNKILTENEQSPIPHVATHWKYTYKNFDKRFVSVMKAGVCLAKSDESQSICDHNSTNSILELMFNFQQDDKINCEFYNCLEMQKLYQNNLFKYKFNFSSNALKNLSELDQKFKNKS